MSGENIVTEVSDLTSEDTIIPLVQAALYEETILAQTLMNVSKYALTGSKTISFPKKDTVFEVKKKATGVKTQGQKISYDLDILALDQLAYIRFSITDQAKIQNKFDIEGSAILESGGAHGEDLDKYLYGLLYLHAQNAVNFTGTSNIIAFTDIIDARRLIKKTKVKPFKDNVFLAVNSSEEASMLKIDNYISAEKYGSSEVIRNGEMGKVHGVHVLVSESVTEGAPIMYHSNALAWGFQDGPAMKRAEDLDNIGTEYLVHQLYGAKVLRNGLFATKMGVGVV